MSFTTPNRRTRYQFDVPDSGVTSSAWGVRRRGGEVAQRAAAGQIDDALHHNVKLWPTGAWTLRPIQTEISNITEYSVGLSLIQTVPGNTVLPALANVAITVLQNQYRYNNDLPGLPASGTALPTGAPFVVKQIPAGASWDMSLPSGTPSLISGQAPPVTPLDRVGESNSVYPENQAWFLSWNPSGTSLSYPEYVFAFYFGQYGLCLKGSGKAELYEYVQYQFDGSRAWIKRKEWKYARTGQVSDTAHSMAIWPHVGPRGENYIAFTNGQLDFAEITSSAYRAAVSASSPGDTVYVVNRSDPRYVVTPSQTVTTAGPFKFDIRRDLQMKLQVSTLGWPSSGYLVDDPAQVPDQLNTFPINAYAETNTPAGTSLAPTLLDALTGAPYSVGSSSSVVARFDFASDGKNTPILWGYSMNRIALIDINAPGAFTGGNLKSVNIAGYSGDPTQETGHLIIDDVRGELLRLLNRGQCSAQVLIDHVENGQTYTTPVFFGYVNRPQMERKVRPGRVYPSPIRHKFSLDLTGLWLRLAEAVNRGPLQYSFYDCTTNPADPLNSVTRAPGGVVTPWKCTDAIIYLLGAAGMTQSQINIPDLPLRLWPGVSEKPDEWVVNPTSDYAELAQRICTNFLGLYLCYDLPTGQWVLIDGSAAQGTPLYTFYTGSAGQVMGRNAPDSAPNAYGPQSTFITEFHLTNVSPEYNAVHVFTTKNQTNASSREAFDRWLFNYNSFPVPGSGFRPDPANPDYLGRMRETDVGDDSLIFIGDDYTTHAAVYWTARRIYDFCCHAQRLAHFESPLVFVLDPRTGQYRLPRFMDPITINGQRWVVKCCAPHYTSDTKQMAAWEVIQPVAGQYIPPGVESLTMLRNTTSRHSAKRAGNISQSNRFGLYGVPPHAESRLRDLPRNINGYFPGQFNDGSFPFMAGYSAVNGPDRF